MGIHFLFVTKAVDDQIGKLETSVDSMQSDVEDINADNDLEREKLMHTMRQLSRQLKLKEMLWKFFIPQKYLVYKSQIIQESLEMFYWCWEL